mgnify:CR=1 FL=1
MDCKDGKTGLSAEHERLFKGPQNRHVFQLLQRYGNPAHAVAAGKSGNCRNHKPIHAAARKLKPTQRGKDKPSDTDSNKQQGLAHARLEPPFGVPYSQPTSAAQYSSSDPNRAAGKHQNSETRSNRKRQSRHRQRPAKQPQSRGESNSRTSTLNSRRDVNSAARNHAMPTAATPNPGTSTPEANRIVSSSATSVPPVKEAPLIKKVGICHAKARTRYGTRRRGTDPLSSSRHGFGLNVYPARKRTPACETRRSRAAREKDLGRCAPQ